MANKLPCDVLLMAFVFGSGDRMKDLERRIGSIARSGLPVLVEGALGTGKEALAELIHDLSGAGGGMTKILCWKSGPVLYPSGFSENRVANLADVHRQTRGTMFLKNVHLLPPIEQDQLLAALERVPGSDNGNNGANTAARIVSSTTESLERLVSRGELNPALYHRLSVYRIWLPPLRERREDIRELMEQMVLRAANGDSNPPPVTPQLLQALLEYDWPGNLRELQNIARAYVVAGCAAEIIEEISTRTRLGSSAPATPPAGESLKQQVKGASQRLEAEIILRTLEHHRWNRRRAAQTLQISYRSLLYKMKNCNLRLQTQPAPEGKRDL